MASFAQNGNGESKVAGHGIGRVRRALGSAIAALLAAAIVGGAEPQPSGERPVVEATTEAPGEDASPAKLPSFLAGVDLLLPAQEAFRGWPPRGLTERPVWFPWGVPAFRKAQLFDRPVLLVMLAPWNRDSLRIYREVLLHPEVASTVNDGYLMVLLDIDRRPDIRIRYQTGTWPALSWLLPDGLPMLSRANPRGVNAPITAGYVDVPTMKFLLEEARTYYRRQGASLREQAAAWAKQEAEEGASPGIPDAAASDAAAGWLLANHDGVSGGFGVAPKFPIPGLVEYASLRALRGEGSLLPVALATIETLVKGPLYDREGGGFRRMALAPGWGDVQPEKMLEVNAHLLRELSFAVRLRDSEDLRAAIRGTAGFLTGTLARPEGGFYLGEIAGPERGQSGTSLDRLVLAGPNALAGAALLRAGIAVGDAGIEKAGRDALDYVLGAAILPGRGAEHILDPDPDGRRYLETQAETAFGFVDAYETTGDPRYLDAARDLLEFCSRNLLEAGTASFRDHVADPADVGILSNPRRPMRENVLLGRTMLRLWAHGLGADFRERAASVLGSFSGNLGAYAAHGTAGALGVEETIRPPVVVRIEARRGDGAASALRREALRLPWTWTVIATGEKAAGRAEAVVRCGGEEQRARRPEELASAVERCAGAAPLGARE